MICDRVYFQALTTSRPQRDTIFLNSNLMEFSIGKLQPFQKIVTPLRAILSCET